MVGDNVGRWWWGMMRDVVMLYSGCLNALDLLQSSLSKVRTQNLCNEAVSVLCSLSPRYLLTNIFARQCFCPPRPVVEQYLVATATL